MAQGRRASGHSGPPPQPKSKGDTMRTAIMLLALATTPFAAQAEMFKLKPVAEARLRFEAVDQDGLARNADALTLRGRIGLQASSGEWSALVQAQGNLALNDDYYDGLQGDATRPLVADPENVALYLAQIQYKTKTIALTAGRQRISLDDERFVGNVGFRQNGQTFDAVRAEWTP